MFRATTNTPIPFRSAVTGIVMTKAVEGIFFAEAVPDYTASFRAASN
jgi:hypothetical protein